MIRASILFDPADGVAYLGPDYRQLWDARLLAQVRERVGTASGIAVNLFTRLGPGRGPDALTAAPFSSIERAVVIAMGADGSISHLAYRAPAAEPTVLDVDALFQREQQQVGGDRTVRPFEVIVVVAQPDEGLLGVVETEVEGLPGWHLIDDRPSGFTARMDRAIASGASFVIGVDARRLSLWTSADGTREVTRDELHAVLSG